ncbi:PREDICTED: astacin-like metalloprotease toxin 2, partial [Amphimedon queenslandica]|uniref:Metalloendopeptidase n=1 Tax=Amphimedon queenslandica TaxID=400682 RepID=A0AAN0IP03_AMPQE
MKLTFVIFCLTTIVTSRQIPAAQNDKDFAANQEIVKESAVPQDTYENSCFEASSDEEEDGIIIDGDILVSKEQAAIYYESGWDGLVNSEAWENTKRWGKKIPYKISYSDKEMKDNPTEINKIVANVESSMKAIEDKTGCIKFSKASCTDFIRLKFNIGKDRKCYTTLGRPVFGNRDISLGYNCAGTPCRAMTPAHEIMHTMGRHHEHNRPDRDTYVTIYSKNTCPTQMKIVKGAATKGIEYDYYSVMHYSPGQCATSTHLSFSIKKSNILIHNVGQRKLLTDKDIQHIKAIHCSSMMMRLVGGRDNSEGRLEVNNKEVWGTVCSDGFDTNDANVVCKYL